MEDAQQFQYLAHRHFRIPTGAAGHQIITRYMFWATVTIHLCPSADSLQKCFILDINNRNINCAQTKSNNQKHCMQQWFMSFCQRCVFSLVWASCYWGLLTAQRQFPEAGPWRCCSIAWCAFKSQTQWFNSRAVENILSSQWQSRVCLRQEMLNSGTSLNPPPSPYFFLKTELCHSYRETEAILLCWLSKNSKRI